MPLSFTIYYRCILVLALQLVAVVKTIETGFLQGIPTTMIADMAPSLQDQYNKIMTDPQVRNVLAVCTSFSLSGRR